MKIVSLINLVPEYENEKVVVYSLSQVRQLIDGTTCYRRHLHVKEIYDELENTTDGNFIYTIAYINNVTVCLNKEKAIIRIDVCVQVPKTPEFIEVNFKI